MRKKQIATLFVVFLSSMIVALSGFIINAKAEEPNTEVVLGGNQFIGYSLQDNYKNAIIPVKEYKSKKVNSVQPGANYSFDNMFDGKLNTKWESKWGNNIEKQFDFEFINSQLFTGFSCITRLDNNIDGTPSYFRFQTSEDGISFNDFENISVERKLGNHTYLFSSPCYTKYLRVLTNADALTEYANLFIPSSDGNIKEMLVECENYLDQARASSGLQSGAYRPSDINKFAETFSALSEIEVTDNDKRIEKSKGLFNLAISIKRALLVTSSDLSEPLAQSELLIKSCVVSEDEPLKWSQKSVDEFKAVFEKAKALADSGDNPLGEVYDIKDELIKAINKFKNSSNKPTITSSEGSVNGVMDGLTEIRVKYHNLKENVAFNFDYKNKAQFINITIGSWFGSEQGIRKFKIEYFDETDSQFKPVNNNNGGIFVPNWKTNNNKTEFLTFEFTPVKSSKIRFTILNDGSSDQSYTCLDELSFGVDVAPEDIVISISPNKKSITEGEKFKIDCTVLPFYAPDKTVLFTSSDETVATVDSNGVVTAKSVKKGQESTNVDITCTTKVGGKVMVCSVTVNKGEVTNEQKSEILKKWEIAKKFADKAKPEEYAEGILDKHINKLTEIKEEIDTMGSVGQIESITASLDETIKELNLNSNVTINAVKSLIDRIAGEGSSEKFVIQLISDNDGYDVFEVDFDTKSNKVIIRGNNGVSLATAFNYYLKYYCYQNFPITGPYSISLPGVLPVVEKPFRNVFPYEYRHYFNENCEYKYTTNNYGEEEWRRRLDWMAMNGFNMYLFDFDERPIWLAAADAGEFGTGFTKDARNEIIKSTGIHFYPDFGNYMVSEDSINREKEIGKKVMTWGYELGLEPEIRPFYGALPFMFPNNRADYYVNRSASFKINLPDTIFHNAFAYLAAEWMKMPQGVAISYFVGDNSLSDEVKNQMKELYEKVNDIYYKYMQKVFAFDDLGRTPKYFIKDLVQEQGFVIKNNAYPRDMLRVVDNYAKKLNPERLFIMSSWRVQGWQLDYLDRENTLVIDLRAEGDPRYGTTGQFWGANWVWCMLYNFGGNTGLNSNFNHIANEPLRCHDKYEKMKGVAIAPEGADTDPATYELMAENTWRNEPVDVNDWLNKYFMRRYGKSNYEKAKVELESVAEGLISTTYSKFAHEGPTQTLVNAFPYIEGAISRRWGRNDILYDPARLVTVWENMIYASQLMDSVPETFLYDLADYTRQILGDLSKPVYENIARYYKLKDKENTLKYAQMMIDIAYDMDEVLSTVDDFNVGKRLEGARNRGVTEEDKNYFEKFDRAFLTVWIYGQPAKAHSSGLIDYCNRHLAGLMKDYYGRRWQILKNCIEEAFNMPELPSISAFRSKYDGRLRDEIYKFSNDWVDTPNTTSKYANTGNWDTINVSGKLLEKYKASFVEIYNMTFEVKKDNLKSYYDTYMAVEKNEKFDEAKWTLFRSNLDKAKVVLDKADATQLEVNQIFGELKASYQDMIADANIVDKTTLQAEYNAKSEITADGYTSGSYNRFKTALDNAKKIIDKEDATQEEIDLALNQLLDAYGKLKKDEVIIITVDKSYLASLVDGYKLLDKNDYTEATYIIFKNAYDSAVSVMANADATQAEVNDAYDVLYESYYGLKVATIKSSGCGSSLMPSSFIPEMIAVSLLCLAVALRKRFVKNNK